MADVNKIKLVKDHMQLYNIYNLVISSMSGTVCY